MTQPTEPTNPSPAVGEGPNAGTRVYQVIVTQRPSENDAGWQETSGEGTADDARKFLDDIESRA